MRHGSLFSGIGGFDLAAQWMGWENIFHCEWNPFCQQILKYHFPKSIGYNDITKTDFTIHRGQIDILTGGFPCQPHSRAGRQLGEEDDRELWKECKRTIIEIQPRFTLFENVSALLTTGGGRFFNRVLSDLAEIGHNVEWCCLPASAFGAPHIRERIWIISYPNKNFAAQPIFTGYGNANKNGIKKKKVGGKNRGFPEMGHTVFGRIQFNKEWIPEPDVPKLVNGLPHELDEISGYGNAIVPQVAVEIFKAIQKMS